jgi:hypothetical protein
MEVEMIHERDRQLTAVVEEAMAVEDIESAVIFVVSGDRSLHLIAASGIEGAPLDALKAAVLDPAHPIARSLGDDRPSFDVYPMNPGGPRLRSHLPFRNDKDEPAGVLAVAHDVALQDPQRQALSQLADRASRHV